MDALPRPLVPRRWRSDHRADLAAQVPPTEAELVVEVGVKVAEYRGFLDHRYSRARWPCSRRGWRIEQAASTRRSSSTPQPLILVPSEARGPARQLVEAINQLEERERLRATFYFYQRPS